MDQFGSDLNEADGQNFEKRKEHCIKRGECPTCGRKTHKVSRFPFGSGKRDPLTVEGEVIDGNCLRCKPLEGYMTRGSLMPAIPHVLEVPSRSVTEISCEDEMTVTSEITMDPFLVSASARHPSSSSRIHLKGSQFESVTEETPMTEFGRHAENTEQHMDLEKERCEREREIVRAQESSLINERRGRPQSGRGEGIHEEGVDTEESEEEDEMWGNHEHFTHHIEQQHNFHLLYVQHNFSNSEQSISLTDNKDGINSPVRTHVETNHNSWPAHKQQFHPLSTIAHFSNSERSISLNDDISHASASASAQSSDSEKILRLCQGSRSSLTMEAERIISKGPSEMMQNNSKKQRSQAASKPGEHSDTNRFCLKRLSSSPNASDDEKGEVEPFRAEASRRKGRQKEPNRFSLTRLDSKGKKLEAAGKESNRFSLNQNGFPGSRCVSSTSGMPPNFQMEMNASKNWESIDILRDAAAEANGEDLDAAVDALFGPVDVKSKPTHKLTNTGSRASEQSFGRNANSWKEDLDHEDEVNVMAKVLARGSSAHEEAELATTIRHRRKSMSSEGNAVHLSAIKDIPVIIRAVKLRPTDEKCIERAFQSLFLLATDPDPEGSMARKEILAQDGMDTLVSAIWHHMQHSHVLLALFHALWAVSVFNQKEDASRKATISKIHECGVLQGLLFAMQSHSKDLCIQESGCDLITRLTGLLPSDTPEFKSAVNFLSKNILIIDINTKAYSSCLDALNSLCQISDANKREFANAGNDCHNAIIRGLMNMDSSNLEIPELACQLFWCVTSDRTAVSVLSSNSLLSKKVTDALNIVPRVKSSVHFYGAACGTLANIALDSDNHVKMIGLGVVPILCDAIYFFNFSADVNSAACTALANLSAKTISVRKTISSQGGIPALFSVLKSTSDSADVQSEALRALHNLCESSLDDSLTITADLDTIITAFFRHEAVKYVQQITGSIICRLSAKEKCRKLLIMVPRVFDAIVTIMKSNQKKKMIQKAACCALRNISSEESIIPILHNKGFDSLVIDAMEAFVDSEELQEHACAFLMHMGSHSPEASVKICSGEGIHGIVKVMQTIPNSVPLQRASCGALYAITKGDAHKTMAISAGAIDAVIFLMLVHANEIKVLENAVNVLANLSSLKKSTKTIADAGGITTVTETMRSNHNSTEIILSGSRFIRHMALSNPEYANEALGGITPIIGCMDEHPDCAKLVEESCKALRVLVLKSESCKDRVLSVDGVAVIQKTMDKNTTSQRWQTLLLDEMFQ